MVRSDLARLFRIARRQQAYAQCRFANPASGVDRGPSAKPRSNRLASVSSGCIDERRHADIVAARHDLEALRDESAVQPVQRSDIGHCPQGDDVKQGQQVGFAPIGEIAAFAQRADEGDGEEESHTDRGEMTVRGGIVFLVQPVGIDQRHGARKLCGAFVVVDHDHVDAGSCAIASARAPSHRNPP